MLSDEPYRQLYECKGNCFDINCDLWRSFEQGVLETWDEVCVYNKNSTCNVGTWWLNNGVKDLIQGRKIAYKIMIKNLTEETDINKGG